MPSRRQNGNGTAGQAGITRLIACGVFRPALHHLEFARSHPELEIIYLPPVLHNDPIALQREVRQTVNRPLRRPGRTGCLYGHCFPGIDDFCRRYDLRRVPCDHCYELFLGRDRFRKIVAESAGTYFLEQELMRHFREYCIEPLELDDEEMRHFCFGHYRRLLYLRQPVDEDLSEEAGRIASFLGLPLQIRDVEYAYLAERLRDLLTGSCEK